LLNASFSVRSVSYERKVNDKFSEHIVDFQPACLHAFLVYLVRGICTTHFIFQYSLHPNNFQRRIIGM
jgi:hypothetical protein